MKKMETLGKALSKSEMKALKGGLRQCKTYLDCSCGAKPEPLYGETCVGGVCKKVGIGACP